MFVAFFFHVPGEIFGFETFYVSREAFESKRRTLMHFLWKCSANFATDEETGFTIPRAFLLKPWKCG